MNYRGRADCLVKQHEAVGGDAVAPLLVEEALTLLTVFPDRLAERVRRSPDKATRLQSVFIELAAMRTLNYVSCRQKNVGLTPSESPSC